MYSISFVSLSSSLPFYFAYLLVLEYISRKTIAADCMTKNGLYPSIGYFPLFAWIKATVNAIFVTFSGIIIASGRQPGVSHASSGEDSLCAALLFAFEYSILYTASLTLANKYQYDALKIGLVLLSFGFGWSSTLLHLVFIADA